MYIPYMALRLTDTSHETINVSAEDERAMGEINDLTSFNYHLFYGRLRWLASSLVAVGWTQCTRLVESHSLTFYVTPKTAFHSIRFLP
jgi:hypothetical protein